MAKEPGFGTSMEDYYTLIFGKQEGKSPVSINKKMLTCKEKEKKEEQDNLKKQN